MRRLSWSRVAFWGSLVVLLCACAESGGESTVCTFGDAKCDGLNVVVCNAAGTGWALLGACEKFCVDGECADECADDCADAQCGDDGCGGSCGTCEAGFHCDEGKCLAGECVPDCAGKECGDDGCDGSCGECGDGCNSAECVAGVCEWSCVPDCTSKVCGDDGCGCPCGECAGGEKCEDGTCSSNCQPNCIDKECGDDGCNSSCGDCGNGEACVSSTCLPESCDLCGDAGALAPYCIPVAACTTEADCLADNYATEFTCTNGGCVGHMRPCDDDQECGNWCQETYPDAPESCAGLNLKCQTWESCGSQKSGCISTPGSCTTEADCPLDNYNYGYQCEAGECVGELRDCDDDQQCGQWCMETYPDQPAICANLNLMCRPVLCNPGHSQCASVTSCQSTADCPANSYSYLYQCQDGECIGELRNCASDQQCDQWCQESYPDYPELCDDLHVKCVDPS